MPLTIRVSPVLLLHGKRMIRTIQFKQEVDVGNPITTARIFAAQDADELIFLDVQGAQKGPANLIETLNRVSEELFIPLTAGGGVRDCHDIRLLLQNGADKVLICTNALESPILISQAADKFGSQSVVISIDIKGGKVVGNRATKEYSITPQEWACKATELGAGELVVHSVDRDGAMQGYDVEHIRQIANAVNVPVIAMGGVGNLRHFKEGIDAGANAIAASSIYFFSDQNIIKAKTYLKNEGYKIR